MRHFPNSLSSIIIMAGLLFTMPLHAEEQGQGYEQAPEFVPGQIPWLTAKGANHQVSSPILNDGRLNHFIIESPHGQITAVGNALALERVVEMEAIAKIKKIKKTDAFVTALGNAAISPLNASEKIITQPLQTIKDLPGGISQLFNNVYTSLSSIGKSQSAEQGETLKELLGYQKAKRQIAAKLGVDPYSSNQLLQKELKNVAWAAFAGGGTIDAVMLLAPTGVAGLAIAAVQQTADVSTLVRDSSPTTLLAINTKKLAKMGVAKEVVEAFNFHPHCTPRHQTNLVDSLALLPENAGQGAFVNLATTAKDETACRDYMIIANNLRIYHQTVRPLRKISIKQQTIIFSDADGRIVVPVHADYLTWNQNSEQLLAAFPAQTPNQQRMIWLSGSYSNRLALELGRRNIIIDHSS